MPQYFFKYPKIVNNNALLTDLLTRANFAKSFLENEDLYYTYSYSDSDTPEIIASKYYKNPELHWIILLTNTIFDPNFDFPMSYEVFEAYIEDKYKDYRGVGSLKIENYGSDYVDGFYERIPLTVSNESEVLEIGTGLTTNMTISGGRITNISVLTGGNNYPNNSIFSVDNSYLGGSGSNFSCSILNYFTGLEYALYTPHPIFGYRKQISISEPDRENSTTTEYHYVDENYYYNNIYDEIDPYNYITTEDGTDIVYKVLRAPIKTIYDYEQEINESKREIRILKEEFYPYVVEQFVKLISK